MQQAMDFLDESRALCVLLTPISEAEFETPSQFKGWTINNIIRHLHVWNIAVDLSLQDEAAFGAFVAAMMAGVRGGKLPEFEARYLNGLSGHALRNAWIERAGTTADAFARADPKLRLKWVGPDMSALSSITARLMETWAHGQAVYDVLGMERQDTDRIGNIVRLGVNTWGFSWKNRRIEPPGQMPKLRLSAPSGAVWEYGEPCESGMISGSATEFCQVVTQCRNIADTALEVTGEVAHQWMAVAQCFAGPPQDPPAKGIRHKAHGTAPTGAFK
ncbi:MAG: TIGR03084 family protein [Sphingomonadaceae bacterium]|nr:TIGR03084 family protein [Sphingomonadaceae bacterium]